ncbi:MAG: hypothetical protein DRO92_01580 [Candidatus Altiarchaeales archaeon]|nr:MAG: hypothetical protein DRO92_01580 [Candidatus Altiarchaeales archaeon]
MKVYATTFLLISILFVLLIDGCIEPKIETTTTTQVKVKVDEVRESYIYINSQKLVAGQLTVKEAYLKKPGYVVIYTDNNGSLGDVIARSPIIEGKANNIKIRVINYSGQSPLYAVIHYDDGDGIFEFPESDMPDETLIVKKFSITKGTTTTTTTTTITTTTTEYESRVRYIYIRNLEFRPKNLIIHSGDTVKWINRDSVEHRISSPYTFDSGELKNGEVFAYTFEKEGIYNYICKIYPTMKGMIIVER